MKSEFLYNPEDGYPHAHAATLAKVETAREETLMACWYAYPEKEHEKARLAWSLLKDDGHWTKAKWVFNNPTGSSQGNPVLINLPGDKTGLLFVFIEGHYWDDAVTYFSLYENGSFQKPIKTDIPKGVMIRHRSLLNDGRMLLPAYHEKNKTCNFFQGTDGIHWKEISNIGPEMIQGDITLLGGKEIQCFIRPTTARENVLRVASADGGKTWMKPVQTSLYCPLSGIAAFQYGEHTVVAHNHTSEHKRNPLTLSLSPNKGHDWPCHYNIEESDLEFSYPTIIPFNGELHMLYTYNRKMIKHLSLPLEELKDRMKENSGCL